MKAKSEHVILLGSLNEPDSIQQLDKLLKITREHGDWDIIVDLSDITINSRAISVLVQLREIARNFGRELILCGIDTRVRSVFTVSGLDGVLHMVDDRASAMAELERIRQGNPVAVV